MCAKEIFGEVCGEGKQFHKLEEIKAVRDAPGGFSA